MQKTERNLLYTLFPESKRSFSKSHCQVQPFPANRKGAQYHGYSSTNTTDVLDQVHVQQQDGLSWVS